MSNKENNCKDRFNSAEDWNLQSGDAQMMQTWLFSVIVTKSPDLVCYTMRVALHPSQLAFRLRTP